MSSTPDDRSGTVEGSSTDQHVSDLEETGTFITDEEPSGTVPAHGSSNAGINRTGANKQDRDDT
ncbi:hypothetical protein [Actinoplanes sp. GCM10030250]|uniref:hypothetical protein n=1 Tax=Actinoplanes sp. GCM10030250 TaxID=3273376 RepID=UPI00361AD667